MDRLCKDNVKLKLIFTLFKIGSMFSTKDLQKILYTLESQLVYKFACSGCNASYIGETNHHLSTRVKEHLYRDKSSQVYKHPSRHRR